MARGYVRTGVNYRLEAEADRILARGRQGVKRIRDKNTYLSPGQLARRRSKEVYNRNGVAEARLFSGMYKRAYNPNAGKKPTGLRSSEKES